MSNRNTLYADILVDELARAGLKHVCLAPGSRNTPLVLAFARHPAIRATSHLDERSAAFFALGLALANAAPVAVVCTSGSAAANFFPAIVEAHQSQVPLLILTADRPPELRHSGANQTIDQIKLFGDYALWSVDAPLPEATPTALLTRSLRTLAGRAIATANGPCKGVVHLNLPLRPPLEPTPVASDTTVPPQDAPARPDHAPYTHFTTSHQNRMRTDEVQALADIINRHERGVIVCGPRCPTGAFGELVAALSQRSGYPALVDGISGARFGQPAVIGGYDTFLYGQHPLEAPDVVIRFGAVPTSKWLNQYLDTAAPRAVVHMRGNGVWADDSHRVSHFIHADECSCIHDLLPHIAQRQTAWMQAFQAAEQTTWQTIADEVDHGAYFDGGVVYDTLDLLPEGAALFTGNSLPVRHLDQFGRPGAKRICAYANRGASGIDGNLSTALGIGYARPDMPLVAIVGDITFYHDMNGLLAVRRCGIPITIILLNNDGGGIFHRLPIHQFEPEFTQYFVTPHGLDFTHAAQLYGLEYVRSEDRASFRQALGASVAQRAATIIEVRTDARVDLTRRQQIIAAVQTQM